MSNAYPRQAAYILHVGDTWKANEQADPELRPALGLLHAVAGRSTTGFSFFDPDGREPRGRRTARAPRLRGRRTTARPATARTTPRSPYKKAFAPRLGLTYALNPKTLFRAGWGIFYDRAFYPGWGGGITQDGFTSNVAFEQHAWVGCSRPSSSQDGFPQHFTPPPFIQSDYRNGQGI